ncbi:MAG: DNA methyltransferase [Candidatus Thorarchaeota archaeon]
MNDVKPLTELLYILRDTDGFPVGEDEDILAISDPPFYMACPNPYIKDFINENGKTIEDKSDNYNKEPFIGDLTFGRVNKIYNMHSYHTKVPPEAINSYIKHYTEPGDIIFDGFSGTGMTGVSAGITGRKAILSDLSPIASFISYNNNTQFDITEFFIQLKKIINEVKNECAWLYDTIHLLPNGEKRKAEINYIIWSNVYTCPYCDHEYIYWDNAISNGKTLKKYECEKCKALISKDMSKIVLDKVFDDSLNQTIFIAKQFPVLISYIYKNKKLFKKVDNVDFENIERIKKNKIPYWYPSKPMMNIGEKWGDTWRKGVHFGITHTHHFYTKRNLWVLSCFHDKILNIPSKRLRNMTLYFFTSLHSRSHKMNRYIPDHNRHVGPLSGTLYVSFLQVEINVLKIIDDKYNTFKKACPEIGTTCITSTQSLTDVSNYIQSESIDYIFTDPPFGDNLIYSELNFILESWLKTSTNLLPEAIISFTQNKDVREYKKLMINCFINCYKILKPNRWMTVVFHNSKSEIWNVIQDAIVKSGFIISQVNILDKKKGTTKQLTYSNATKNDLVISAYKPSSQFEKKFLEFSGVELEEEFLRMHLTHLAIEPNIERTEQMLYSKLLAYYVQRGYYVRYDASGFYKMLKFNFVEEDGYWFSPDQIESYSEYKKKMKLEGIDEIKKGQFTLFVSDEKSALIWLHTFLNESKDFKTIHPAFTKVANISNDQVPDLRELLENNFIREGDTYRRPQTEDEKLTITQKRERELLREFEVLLLEAKGSKKKIKECRKQVVVYGFEYCYKKNRFQDILTLAKRLENSIIENDSEINEFIEVAELKVEGF